MTSGGRGAGLEGQRADRRSSTTACSPVKCCSPTCIWQPAGTAPTALLERKVTGIAYETVQLSDGALPLLAPMSEVAGRARAAGRGLPPDAARAAVAAC